jgi:hypothetical protein
VGNHRRSLTRDTVGVPVLAVGMPTVIYAATLARDAFSWLDGRSDVPTSDEAALEDMERALLSADIGSMIVTPREIDSLVRAGGRLIGWADAGVIVPYTMWRQFGDVAAVNVNWDAMARFLANLDKSNWTTPENERQCVDWLSPAMYEGHRRGWGSRFCKNPFWDGETNADERQYWDMLGACYHIWDLKMMVEMAKATGRDKEAAAYAQREAKAVARYRNLFLDHHGRFAER